MTSTPQRSLTYRILVVEDEKDVQNLIALHLKRGGFEIETSDDGQDALSKIHMSQQEPYGLIILDWMLPKISGIDVLRTVREKYNSNYTPVLMLTAKTSTSDVVYGLESGADDYLSKPFEPAVLIARARALTRRAVQENVSEKNIASKNKDTDLEVIEIGDLIINPLLHEVRAKGQVLQLTPSEFKLLHALAQNRGRVLTREKLIQLVQGDGVAVVDRAIDTHVFGLRKKMGESSRFVETVRGIGYRIHFSGSDNSSREET